MHRKNGFSAIEIVIAVAVVVILAIIAVPKFADVLRKSEEGATKAGLGALRTAVAMYYGDHEGSYPGADVVKELTADGKYIKEIPYARCPPYHGKSSVVITGNFDENKDSGKWAYKTDDSEDGTGKVKGQIWILCTHKDSKGNVWSEL
ncbi:MAG: prepilin-type N-terminal cleavage/methylation domain-containing protein [Endomicrobia bacterium]|nr:prepilin-type N-terminal cleavage/methylation domain-containing protein [Endomicrobiia bacterium]